MVQSADSRIQSHTFCRHLFSPDVSDHASTNPASFMPCARPQAKRCSTTNVLPNHNASGWTCSSIHSLPWEVRGQNRKTVPSLQTRTSGVFGTTCELLMDACSFRRTRIRVTKKKTAHIQAAHGALCIPAASGRSPLPPCSPSRLVALSRCPDAGFILAGLATRENGPKVLNVTNRGSCETTGSKNFFGGIATRAIHPKVRARLSQGEQLSPKMFSRARALTQRPPPM